MREPNRHHFRSLVADWPHTCASEGHLVVRVDAMSPGDRGQFNTHVDFYALYMVRQGKGIHVIDGVPHGIARGDLYAMGLGTTHAYEDNENLVLDALYFTPDALDEAALEVLRSTPGFLPLLEGPGGKLLHLSPGELSAISTEIEELRAEWRRQSPEAPLLVRALFFRLLVHLARLNEESPAPGQAMHPKGEGVVSAAVRYLDTHFAEPVRIERLADRLFLSHDRFTQVFATRMGRTPRNYLRHVRIERAKSLLRETDMPVNEIGTEVGLGDPAHFARAFRAATGLPPSEFRRQSRA